MSKLEVDKIDPQSGTNLELGTSGDTITIPAGVTFDSSAATNTLPATVVTTDGTQTLTNKSIATTQLTGTITPSDSTVTLAKLTATGTKDATTFLRGDNTFAAAGLNGWSEDGANNNLLPASASAGIYLGVNSATASNLLDDYEEGTWTPTLTCTATGFASVTYDALTGGRYIKVGSLVYITGSVKTDAIDQTGATGNAAIGGLPFNIESNVSGTQSNSSALNIGIANSFAGDVPNSGYYQVNDNKVGLLYRTSVNGDTLALSRLDFDNGADSNVIHFNGTYYST